MPSDDKAKVVIVDDEPLFRDMLRIALSTDTALDIVGTFADGETAVKHVPFLQPDVAILDISLQGDMNGVQLGLLLREQLPKLGIVLLSNLDDPSFLASLPYPVASGWSYLLKKSVTDTAALARAVRGAAEGLVVLDPKLVSGLRPKRHTPTGELTPRQRQVLALMAQGYTNAAIARELRITVKSVENQINSLYQQLGIAPNEETHPRVKAVLMYLDESGIRTG